MPPAARSARPAAARGQAVVEYVAWLAVTAAVLAALGAALVAAAVPQRLAAAVARTLGAHGGTSVARAPAVRPATLALVLAAVHGSATGDVATIGDAERLLAAEIGPDAARAEIARLAVADFLAGRADRLEGVKEVVAYGAEGSLRRDVAGVGEPSSARWHGLQERRRDEPASAHVVTADEARRLRDALHARTTAQLRREELAKLVAETGLGYFSVWVRVPVFAAEVVQALRAERVVSALPAGLREDDVVLCYPVRRRNDFSSAAQRRRWGVAPAALDMGRWHDMTHRITVRSGAVVGEVVTDAATCT